jgi:hypothetical protein
MDRVVHAMSAHPVKFHSPEIWLKVIVHLAGIAALFATFLR